MLHATGTREIDHLGGLLKRMPVDRRDASWSASAAISGLPPLNGFVSEFLIYLGGASAGVAGGRRPAPRPAGLVAIGGLALIGGLAAACFTKAFGIVFLGEPRSDAAAGAHECRRGHARARWSCWPRLCLAIGLPGRAGAARWRSRPRP